MKNGRSRPLSNWVREESQHLAFRKPEQRAEQREITPMTGNTRLSPSELKPGYECILLGKLGRIDLSALVGNAKKRTAKQSVYGSL